MGSPRHFVIASLALSLVAVAWIVSSASPPASRPAPETETWQIITAQSDGKGATDSKIAALQQQLLQHGPDAGRLERIGWLFVGKARETGDGGFFHLALAAARILEAIAADGSPAVESSAGLLRGSALHGLHRFSEAEQAARRVVARRGLAHDHGLLGDVLIDQGRLEEAVQEYEAMMRLKPGAEAFARAGHVRFLTGDVEGSIEALRLAARAVSPRTPERFAWVWSRLSASQLHAGRLDAARASAERAAAVFPEFAPAELARARVFLAEDRFEEAIPFLQGAARGPATPATLWALSEAQREVGRPAEALATELRMVREGGDVDPRGLALWLAHTGNELPRALELARREFEARRDPYTLDALAWAEHAAGDADVALALLERALAFGTLEPRFELHAAAITAALGDAEAARIHRGRAASLRYLLLPSERTLLATLAGREVSDGSTVGWHDRNESIQQGEGS